MSAHYSYYSKIDGNCAFLSGSVSAFADAYLCEILPKYWALEADVFETDTSDLCDSIRKKLLNYMLKDNDDVVEKIGKLEFELQPESNELPQLIHNLFARYKGKSVPNEIDMINRFVSNVRFQLGNIKDIYSIKGGLNELITDALSEFYTYVVFQVYFIEYEGYIVMLVFGSDE